jgi:hypothetical protein
MAGGAIAAMAPFETLLPGEARASSPDANPGGDSPRESHERLEEILARYGSEMGGLKAV